MGIEKGVVVRRKYGDKKRIGIVTEVDSRYAKVLWYDTKVTRRVQVQDLVVADPAVRP